MGETARSNDEPTTAPKRTNSLEGRVVGGNYRVLELLGSGGMGDVYEAEHVRLGNPVALKVLRAESRDRPRDIERFRDEAERVALVRSESIVKVFDCGELDDGTPYLVMERLFGEDLRALLEREGPLPVRRAVKLVIDACRGLSVMHAAGLVHRDLKPANLFIEKTASGAETCKILDFGVVKVVASETTRQGVMLGTLRYMAPEQLENAAAATPSADLYAVGAILYEALTGRPVHSAATLQQTMYAILHRTPTPPSEFRALPKDLEVIILRALSRDVAARFGSADELASALASFGAVAAAPRPFEAFSEDTLAEASFAPSRSLRHRTRVWKMNSRWLAAGVLGIGAVAGWFARGSEVPARGVPHVAASRSTTALPLTISELVKVATIPTATASPNGVASVPSTSAPSSRRKLLPRVKGGTNASFEARPLAGSANPTAGRFDPRDPYE